MKITQRAIASIDDKHLGKVIWDDELGGFGIRVNRDRTVSYIAYFRVDGKQRKKVIGRANSIKVEEARRRARVLIGAASDGQDVIGKKAEEENAPTIAQLGERFKEEYIPHFLKPSTQEEYRRNIDIFITPELGHHKVKDIPREAISKFHTAMSDRPYQANRVLGVLSKMLSQAEVWDLRPDGANPCLRVKRFKEKKRERFLSSTELKRLSEALDLEATTAPVTAAAFRLLIFTGCRLGEIQHLRWGEVDFEREEIRLPDSKTGQKTIYLTAETIALLKSIPRLPDNPFVIHGLVPGQHLTDFQKPWRRIRKAADLNDVRIHDLRHTFASVGASNKLSLPIIGKLLGHTQAQTTARYAHLAAEPIREANAGITKELAAMMGVASQPSKETVAKTVRAPVAPTAKGSGYSFRVTFGGYQIETLVE